MVGGTGVPAGPGHRGARGGGGSGKFFALLFFRAASWSKFVGKNSETKATGFGKGFGGLVDIQSLILTRRYDFKEQLPKNHGEEPLFTPTWGPGVSFQLG